VSQAAPSDGHRPLARPSRGRWPVLLAGFIALSAGALLLTALAIACLHALLVDPAAQVSLRILPPAILLLAVALALLRATGDSLGAQRVLASGTLAAVSLISAVALLVAPASLGVAGEGPFERSLLIAAVVGLAGSPLLIVLLRRERQLRAWLAVPVGSAEFATRGEVLVLVIIVAGFALIVIRIIAVGMIFGFDESIYALTTRWWIAGTPNTGWASHRSPGISILGAVPLALGASEAAFRTIGLLSGVGALLLAWRLGRRLAGPTAGLVAALAIACIPDLQLNAALFLTDVPSAALILLLALLAWRRFEGGAGDAGLLLLAPVAATAFYVRYGASLPILFIALAALLIWPRRIAAMWRRVLLTAALLLVLLIPHFVEATAINGSPWSIALSARNLAAPDYPGQALGVYLGGFFSFVAGPVAGAVAAAGLIGLIWHLVGVRRWDATLRARLFLVVPALAVGLLLGEVALAQTRYIYVPLMLLAIAGGIALADGMRRLPSTLRGRVATLGVGIGLVVMLNGGADVVRTQQAYAPEQRWVIEAAHVIRDDALARDPGADRPDCSVLSYLVPAITWYSGCATYHFSLPPVAGREALLTGPNRYLMLVTGHTERQPQGALLQQYLDLVEPQPFATVNGLDGRIAARIYRFRSSSP
jgi:hypothetical protein